MKLELGIMAGAESKAFLMEMSKLVDRMERVAGTLSGNDKKGTDDTDEDFTPAKTTKATTKKAAASLDDDDDTDTSDDDGPLDSDDEDELTAAPTKKASKATTKKAAASLDEDEDDTDEDELEVKPAKKASKATTKKAAASLDDDDDTDTASDEDEDEDEELDVKPAKKTRAKTPAITDSMVNDACKERMKRLIKRGQSTVDAAASIKKLLKTKFGVKSISQVPPEHYGEVIQLMGGK